MWLCGKGWPIPTRVFPRRSRLADWLTALTARPPDGPTIKRSATTALRARKLRFETMGTGPSFAAQSSLPQSVINPEPEFVELAVGGDGQYDIRRYAPHVSVNCISTPSMPEGEKYGRIAQFLGLYKPGFVQPANKAGRILARTLTKPTILSYPTPAQNKGYYYSPEFAANIFVGVQGGSIMHMPLFGYARAADVPAPTLACINVTDVPARIIAARAYRGTFGKAISKVPFSSFLLPSSLLTCPPR